METTVYTQGTADMNLIPENARNEPSFNSFKNNQKLGRWLKSMSNLQNKY